MINERANSISFIVTEPDLHNPTGRRAVSRTISIPTRPKGRSISIPFQPSIDYQSSSNTGNVTGIAMCIANHSLSHVGQ